MFPKRFLRLTVGNTDPENYQKIIQSLLRILLQDTKRNYPDLTPKYQIYRYTYFRKGKSKNINCIT